MPRVDFRVTGVTFQIHVDEEIVGEHGPRWGTRCPPQFFNLDHGVLGIQRPGLPDGVGAASSLGLQGQIPFLHCCSVFRVAVLRL